MTATAQTEAAAPSSVLSLLICLIPKVAVFSRQAQRHGVLLPQPPVLRPRSLWLTLSLPLLHPHLLPKLLLPLVFALEGSFFFFFFPFIFLFPSLICLSCCRQGCSLSADSAIPSLTLPTPFYSLYPSSLVLCPSHLPAQPWGHYAQGFFASVSGFLLCGCFLPSPGAFTHPSSLCSSIFCLFPVTSSSPSFVARPRYPQCEALRELRMFTGRL